MMNSDSPFAYQCNACGRCCHDQVITLSPYDVIRLARAAHLSTTETIARFTLRRGSLLRFDPNGACHALDGAHCTVHSGRPLACRLYPLGLQRSRLADSRPHASASGHYVGQQRGDSRESFTQLEPADGSAGIYGTDSTVAAFLESQGVAPYLNAAERYYPLIPLMRDRIAALTDFDRIEPREFWRRAFHEAMRETNCDPNPLITSIFDADAAVRPRHYHSEADLIDAHLSAIAELIRSVDNPAAIAVAAFLLAVSLGYASTDVNG
jgi:Fe-S-cluster containining protein